MSKFKSLQNRYEILFFFLLLYLNIILEINICINCICVFVTDIEFVIIVVSV